MLTVRAQGARMHDLSKYRYSAKRFGLGWRTPLTWEGWAIDLSIVAFFFCASPWFRTTRHGFLALACLFVPLLMRGVVAHLKGEPDGGR